MNSKEVAWGDFSLYVNGVFITKIIEIQYTLTRDKEILFAAGDEGHGIQRGNKGGAGSVVLLKNAVDMINRAVVATGLGDDILDADFMFVCKYKMSFSRPIQIDTLVPVEFTEEARGIVQNQKSMPVRLPFLFLKKLHV